MGQKVRPTGFRIGITESWRANWYASKKEFGALLVEDQKIRKYIKDNYNFVGIARIDIERTREEITVILHAARPGLIIGRKGVEIERLKDSLERLTNRQTNVNIKIKEVNKPELQAQLVAENIAEQMRKSPAYKKVVRKAVDTAIDAGAKGVKVQVSGRLGGNEIARSERITIGSLPLHTLRADIDYGFAESFTTYGAIGIKVWIYKGLIPTNMEGIKDAVDAKEGKV